MHKLDEFVQLIKKLRSKDGCPWDKEQTLETLKPHLLEETYEVLEAMDIGGDSLKGELGDLLLQIVFQSNISEEKGEFSIGDVIESISEKMIRRHPH
ncbi:MAG: MazG nucleotide pyrophosphohydrolase domain-containing protein, partial [Cetobacterium sp.]